MRRRHRNRLAKAKAIGFGQSRIRRRVVLAFIDAKNDRQILTAQEIGKMLVHRRQAGPAIDKKQNGIGLLHRRFRLPAHPCRNGIIKRLFQPRRIDHPDRPVENPPRRFPPVPRHPRLVIDDGQFFS